MKLSKLTLASVSILLGINVASCTGQNVKTSQSSLSHEYADCTFEGLASNEPEKVSTAVAVAEKAKHGTKSSSSEPEQESAGCILQELE